jgi:hypothetical protein
MEPQDFYKPDGDLPPNRFPDIDLQAYVETWIERGKKQVERWLSSTDYHESVVAEKYESFPDPVDTDRRERAIKAFVYWKAWDHIHERLSGEPKRQSTESWSARYSQSQIESYRSRAKRAKEEFEDIVSGDDALQDDDTPRSVATSVEISP